MRRVHRPVRQDGVALLAVALALVVVGALALSMSREGAMEAHSVASDYDTAAARSLAGAALNMAKWRNQRAGCGSAAALAPTTIAGVGTLSATVARGGSKTLAVVATGSTLSGASVSLERPQVIVHDLTKSTVKVVSSNGAEATYLDAAAPDSPMAGAGYLELGDGARQVLLRFTLNDLPSDASILSAQLGLWQYQAPASAAPVSVHRVANGWSGATATWNSADSGNPWEHPGGDFSIGSVAVRTVGPNAQYLWDITTLVDGWFAGLYPNYGMLLKADGPLQQARYYNFLAASGSRPSLTVTYLPAC